MKCPVCKADARVHIFYCAACGVYVHEKCWNEHEKTAHQDDKR